MAEKDLEQDIKDVHFDPDGPSKEFGTADGVTYDGARRRSTWARTRQSLAREEGWQKRDAFASVSAGKGEDSSEAINYQTLTWW